MRRIRVADMLQYPMSLCFTDPIVVNTPRLQKTIDAVMSRLNEDLYQPVFQQIDQVSKRRNSTLIRYMLTAMPGERFVP